VHPAPRPTSDGCLLASGTGSGPGSTSASIGQIGKPSFNIGLTHGVVCHS
jgi:hypothetical protein